MKQIRFNNDKESLKQVAEAIKQEERFTIITKDPHFNPLGNDYHSANVWIAAAGGGGLMTIGAGSLLLAFLDSEPTSKLGILVTGGIILSLAGGGLLLVILLTRSLYTSNMKVNSPVGDYEWVLTPR
jgi:hypothetical protein